MKYYLVDSEEITVTIFDNMKNLSKHLEGTSMAIGNGEFRLIEGKELTLEVETTNTLLIDGQDVGQI